MTADQGWLRVQGAVDEILRRRGTEPNGAPSGAAGPTYGQLYAPPRDDIEELRRQQAEFARTTAELDRRNAWMAVPALAPALAVLGAEAVAMLAARGAAGAGVGNRPLNLLDREPWLRNSRPPGTPLSGPAKGGIRETGRNIWFRANNVRASELDAHVHHSEPLEWAHLKPGADPNRLANLWALSPKDHAIATREWAAFSRALKGREPTPAEVMEAKMRIDRLVAPSIRRPGVSRPNPSHLKRPR